MRLFFILCLLLIPNSVYSQQERVTQGLIGQFDFGQHSYETIRDSKRIAFDLRSFGDVKTDRNGLLLSGTGRLQAETDFFNTALRASGALTVELWLQPQNLKQKGPARILTLSADSTHRNLTIGQEGDRYDVRLRTTRTGENGLPSTTAASAKVSLDLTHLVFTFADQTTRLYLNGNQVATSSGKGQLTSWAADYKLAFGDEITGQRPWNGRLRTAAIYRRALSEAETKQNFQVGPTMQPTAQMIAAQKRSNAKRHFETKIAPLLADHCLECHDAASRQGGLDLSHRETAFQESDNGIVLVKGDSTASSLWESVESDAMPHNRPALSSDEKQLLKTWIDDGAVWTLPEIDPAVYVHRAAPSFVQRLTVDEYIRTVQSVTGIDVEDDARKLLPADLRADGFSNTAYNLNVDLKHVAAYSELAQRIVSRMDVGKFIGRYSRRRRFTDRDMEDVITKVGHWVLRGPISKEEVIAYRGITTTVASAGGNFDEAMGLVLEGMLQSPRFLYRLERTRGPQRSVSQYELASRLSYILWGTSPDEELLNDAKAGDLSSRIPQQLQRMLQDDQAREQMHRFFADWLDLARLENLTPNAQRFPDWTPGLAVDMHNETMAFVDEVVWKQQQPLSRLMNYEAVFASAQLARFYGLDPDSGQSENGMLTFVTKPGSPRGGLLTQGSLLTIGGDDASTVTRGLLVMHQLLRGVVKDPPPCVDTTPVPGKEGLTKRDIAMSRIRNPSCGGCHSKFEPLSFGLEKFNGIGQYSDTDEHGNRVRDDGEILFPGQAQPAPYSSSAEMMNLLAESDRVKLSLTWKVTQFALGRPLTAADAATVHQIHQTSQQDGGSWAALMSAIASSDFVRLTR